ncbi:MAG TPA: hypothetical protein VFX51_11985 [Solirubrobacteraceae bacterium]|nr:hypothetical protein [Solirubrobacteraceae bacterium]
MLPILGLAGALVAVAGTIPYLRDMVRGTTLPHRGTWLIWSLLSVLVFFSQRADGATWSLVVAGMQVLLNSLIFVFAVCRGVGGVSLAERIMLAIAAGGALGWIAADDPFVATACVVAADLVGLAMMLPKTYRDPESETLATFALASVSGALATTAVGSADLALIIYPIYLCLGNLGLAILIQRRRQALTISRMRPRRLPRASDPAAASSGTS